MAGVWVGLGWVEFGDRMREGMSNERGHGSGLGIRQIPYNHSSLTVMWDMQVQCKIHTVQATGSSGCMLGRQALFLLCEDRNLYTV